MKSINKFLLSISVILAVALSACEKEVVRELSPEANASSNKVYFPDQESKLTLPIDATSIPVTIARDITNAALTVSLHFSGGYADLFTIPQTVNFASGEAETTFEVKIGNIELMKSYNFQIEVADFDQTNPYMEDTKYPIISFSVLKEDFQSIGMGQWTDGIVCAIFAVPVVTYEVEVEYSENTGLYRLVDPYGFDVYPFTEEGDVVRIPTHLVINANDPDDVIISGTAVRAGIGIGIDYGYGEIFIGLRGPEPGVMIDKTITFAGGSTFQVGMADYNNGAFSWWCQECKLVLP